MVDSKNFGVLFDDCNKTVEPCTLKNSMLAMSIGPNKETGDSPTVFGLPWTENFVADGVDLHNFNGGTLLHDCRSCNIKNLNAGRIYTFKGITWVNSSGFSKFINWE
jgi:hypothetical protein